VAEWYDIGVVTPSHRNVSEIVFTENLCAKNIVKDGEYTDISVMVSWW
jgi:hypothetical protein